MTIDFDITPFSWIDGDTSVSVIMNDIGSYQQDIFDSRADEGFEGGGYDWQSLAVVFLEEKLPHLQDKVTLILKAVCFVCMPIKKTNPLYKNLSSPLNKLLMISL